MKFSMTVVRTALWLGLAALVACGGADSGPVTADWHTNGNDAKQIALQTHRLLFVAFMGTDWSEPCQVIKKEVLDTAAFKSFADANLVLVMADFPRGSTVSPDIDNLNLAMAKGAQLDRLPVFLLVDPRTGTAFNRIAGYAGGPDGFIAQIQAGLEQYQQTLQAGQTATAASAATPAPADSPLPTGPSFSQPPPGQSAAPPLMPGFPGAFPSPEELMRRQQQPAPRPQ